jgi:phosphate:Na+ symporter
MRSFPNKTFLLTVGIVLTGGQILAGNKAPESVNWFHLIIGLLGGLALFLFGMDKMSTALKKSGGTGMRRILAKISGNRFIALVTGAFVTMLIQSSSATTVMLVSFVQSGLMSFSQSLGVILGANIGTTFTAQLIAFSLTDYAIMMIALGFGLRLLSKKDTLKNIGDSVFGFGLLFYGMKLMSESMEPLRSYPEFIDVLKNLDHPFTGLLVGLIFTALIQSSGAFTGIIIVLAQQKLIGLQAGIPMIIGSNIGTCLTTTLASIGTSREAKRVALAHAILNIGGAMAFIFWIPGFAKIVSSVGGDEARQIANSHTFFNLGIALIFLPFTKLTAKLIIRILPDKAIPETHLFTKYLDKRMLNTPSLAIDLVVAEIGRAVKINIKMFEAVIVPFLEKEIPNDKYHPKLNLKEALIMREEEIDYLDREITEYIMELSKKELATKRVVEIFGLLSVMNNLENISDIIHREMMPLIDKKKELGMDFSNDGKLELKEYHAKILDQMNLLSEVFEKRDSLKAVKVPVNGELYNVLESKFMNRHYTRLHHKVNQSVVTHKLHSELFNALKLIGVHLENCVATIAGASPLVNGKNENTPNP